MRMGWLILVLLAAGTAWALSGGRIARLTRACQVLDELRRPGPESWLRRATPPLSRSALTLESAGQRFAADLYRPAPGAGGVPLILVPGLVEEGKDDPRVPPFAELLARVGFVVVVPDLPSFRTLRVHSDNVRELAAVLDAVTARPDLAPRGRAGLFGISYGGGVALLVALDPAHAGQVPFLATVGAYADLDTALRFLATGRTLLHGHMRRVTPDPYGQLVFLRTYEEFLAAPRDSQLLEAMAARRWRDQGARLADLAAQLSPQGRLIYDLFETSTADEVPRLIERLPPGLRSRMAQLSPGRRSFATLRARLYLVHARDDGVFPVSETYRLARLASARTRVHVVVLDALQHVEPEPWRRDPWGFLTRDLPEAVRLAGWWYALLGERGRTPERSARGPGAEDPGRSNSRAGGGAE
jgi:acetyl esterase/lipase